MYLRDMLRAVTMKQQDANTNELYTPWGEALDPAHVLEEYPRPQLRRGDYVNLNGYWAYAITPLDCPIPAEWDGQILVPFSPESLLSGVKRQVRPEELLWYQRILSVTLPSPKHRIILHFGAVDQDCWVYVNGVEAGSHQSGYLSFSVDITEFAHEGENTLTVKVRDISDTSYRTRGKQKLESGGIFYTAQSGIWQTVWMEYVPQVYMKSLRITPLLDKESVHIQAEMSRNAEHYHLTIRSGGKVIAEQSGEEPDFLVHLSEVHLWTPETPFLYTFTLEADEDRIESYFAMRHVSCERDENGLLRICLNHKPYYMNGVLDQGYWSDGLMTAPSDDALLFDILEMKQLGFNLLRKHAKIECARWYYHCDCLGMLVWQDMPNGGTDYDMLRVNQLPTLFPKYTFRDNRYERLSRVSEESRREWSRECAEMIQQLYNYPSIVVWVLFNEGWGQFDAAKAVELTRQLDSTRLIDAASGWLDQSCGDIQSVHNYFRKQFLWPPKERAFAISELGGYTCHIDGHSYSGGTYGYRIYEDSQDFQAGFRHLMEDEVEPLKEKGLSAIVYTQLSDVEEETNGILTYDRRICKLK